MSERPISLAELELLEAERWSEAVFTSKVRTEAIAAGWLFYHTKDSRGSDRGFPDCVMVRSGRVVYAELKVGNNRPSPEQEAWLLQLSQTRGPAEVAIWYPSSWQAIKAVLR